jgi:hypothetical protein
MSWRPNDVQKYPKWCHNFQMTHRWCPGAGSLWNTKSLQTRDIIASIWHLFDDINNSFFVMTAFWRAFVVGRQRLHGTYCHDASLTAIWPGVGRQKPLTLSLKNMTLLQIFMPKSMRIVSLGESIIFCTSYSGSLKVGSYRRGFRKGHAKIWDSTWNWEMGIPSAPYLCQIIRSLCLSWLSYPFAYIPCSICWETDARETNIAMIAKLKKLSWKRVKEGEGETLKQRGRIDKRSI